jgi:predicted RNA binding protein YcfA (HicA-like mRNA interferase family)
MPKRHSSEDIIKILNRNGFVHVSQKGSHIKMRRIIKGETHTVIIPAGRREIPTGTFLSIVSQSGLARDEFRK